MTQTLEDRLEKAETEIEILWILVAGAVDDGMTNAKHINTNAKRIASLSAQQRKAEAAAVRARYNRD